jgi:hypothetical protein
VFSLGRDDYSYIQGRLSRSSQIRGRHFEKKESRRSRRVRYRRAEDFISATCFLVSSTRPDKDDRSDSLGGLIGRRDATKFQDRDAKTKSLHDNASTMNEEWKV